MAKDYGEFSPNDWGKIEDYIKSKYGENEYYHSMMEVFEWKVETSWCVDLGDKLEVRLLLHHHYFNDEIEVNLYNADESNCDKVFRYFLKKSLKEMRELWKEAEQKVRKDKQKRKITNVA